MNNNSSRPSVIKEVLKAFIPYSSQNLKIAFSPNKFFNDLEKTTGASRTTLSTTFSRAKRNKLIIEESDRFVLSWRGKIKADYRPQEKNTEGMTLVIFDIPETRKQDRYQLRCYLRMMYFKPLQKSVWGSEYAISDELIEVINDLQLQKCVVIFSARQLYPLE